MVCNNKTNGSDDNNPRSIYWFLMLFLYKPLLKVLVIFNKDIIEDEKI